MKCLFISFVRKMRNALTKWTNESNHNAWIKVLRLKISYQLKHLVMFVLINEDASSYFIIIFKDFAFTHPYFIFLYWMYIEAVHIFLDNAFNPILSMWSVKKKVYISKQITCRMANGKVLEVRIIKIYIKINYM